MLFSFQTTYSNLLGKYKLSLYGFHWTRWTCRYIDPSPTVVAPRACVGLHHAELHMQTSRKCTIFVVPSRRHYQGCKHRCPPIYSRVSTRPRIRWPDPATYGHHLLEGAHRRNQDFSKAKAKPNWLSQKRTTWQLVKTCLTNRLTNCGVANMVWYLISADFLNLRPSFLHQQ